MRRLFHLAAGVAVLLLMTAGAAQPAHGAEHEITCASPETAARYLEALAEYHQGRYEEAIRRFEEAARGEPTCAMAHWGLSRAQHRVGNRAAALGALQRAQQLSRGIDDREQRLISAWGRLLRLDEAPESERGKARAAVVMDLDAAISTYPSDPEVWIFRGEAAESPLRAGPFYLAALRLQPDHALGKRWKPESPSAPEVTAPPTQPAPAPTSPPRLLADLGKLSYPITTTSPEAQAFFEQGLRCLHSYVAPSRVPNGAAHCFQHAAALDPECAMAYWGLSFCRPEMIQPLAAAHRALELALKKGTEKERRMCAARVLELSGPERREAFLDALDGLILAHPDDVELWVWRGKCFGGYLMGSNSPSGMPYQIAAHVLQPEHPAPSHELIHLYEVLDRPALGWPYTVAFRRSAPNVPHAHHMQAHLAMRLGRWADALDATRMSRTRAAEGFPELDPAHHVDVRVRTLSHEGLFGEAEAEPRAYRDGLPWARMLQRKVDPDELERWAERRRMGPEGVYVTALVKLDRNDPGGALPFIQQVEEQWKKQPMNIYRHHEVKGRYLVQTGSVDEGLKLLREAAARVMRDSAAHAWGEGSYVLEVWGETALRAHRWDEAEEAFHEALAHEHGSVVGALGMQVLCEHRGQPELTAHYAERAAAIWKGADAGALERQLQRLRRLAEGSASGSAGTDAKQSGGEG